MSAEAGPIRRTVARETGWIRGRGLFTGVASAARIVPGDRGIEVSRVGGARFAAGVGLLRAGSGRNTALGPDDRSAVATVEHALSAMVGMGLTDAVLEVDGPEVPILDGSARDLATAIARAGWREIGGRSRAMVIERVVRVASADGSAWVEARPWDGAGCAYEYELEYGAGAAIGPQRAALTVRWGAAAGEGYLGEVAWARTFCLEAEALAMRRAGLLEGFTPRDLLVIGADGAPIENAWRGPEEAARHKLLDVIGDLALAGSPIAGRIVAHRSGHALNHALARALLGERARAAGGE